jgi:hypothetical protein
MNKFLISTLLCFSFFFTSCKNAVSLKETYFISVVPISSNNLQPSGANKFGSLSYKFNGSIPAYIDFKALIKSKDYSHLDIGGRDEVKWSLDGGGIGVLNKTGILEARIEFPSISSGSAKINVELNQMIILFIWM